MLANQGSVMLIDDDHTRIDGTPGDDTLQGGSANEAFNGVTGCNTYLLAFCAQLIAHRAAQR